MQTYATMALPSADRNARYLRKPIRQLREGQCYYALSEIEDMNVRNYPNL